jgi:hypothetical protein
MLIICGIKKGKSLNKKQLSCSNAITLAKNDSDI